MRRKIYHWVRYLLIKPKGGGEGPPLLPPPPRTEFSDAKKKVNGNRSSNVHRLSPKQMLRSSEAAKGDEGEKEK